MVDRFAKILLVEDDPGDVELTKESLERSKIKVNLDVVENGAEALQFLKKEGKYKDASRPDIVLLDLNLPKKDGRQVLKEIKNDESLKSIPVVVLTSSKADEDILKSYHSGANCYVTKPIGLSEFNKVVHTIKEFWFAIVKLPER